jgi:hypothetical protein
LPHFKHLTILYSTILNHFFYNWGTKCQL